MNSNHWRAISVLQIAPPLAIFSDLIDFLVTHALPQYMHSLFVGQTSRFGRAGGLQRTLWCFI